MGLRFLKPSSIPGVFFGRTVSCSVWDQRGGISSTREEIPRNPRFPQDGILLGAVGAYDWNGAVLKETSSGKVIPPRESYLQEFPEELKNHGAYLGGEAREIRGFIPKNRIFLMENLWDGAELRVLIWEEPGSDLGAGLKSRSSRASRSLERSQSAAGISCPGRKYLLGLIHSMCSHRSSGIKISQKNIGPGCGMRPLLGDAAGREVGFCGILWDRHLGALPWECGHGIHPWGESCGCPMGIPGNF